jgi:hypothetical protein
MGLGSGSRGQKCTGSATLAGREEIADVNEMLELSKGLAERGRGEKRKKRYAARGGISVFEDRLIWRKLVD